jgi:hypothetical protein
MAQLCVWGGEGVEGMNWRTHTAQLCVCGGGGGGHELEDTHGTAVLYVCCTHALRLALMCCSWMCLQ